VEAGRPRRGSAFDVVASAASAGGLTAIGEALAGLPADFPGLWSWFSISTRGIGA
jgi:hypothetical protein